MAGLSSVARNSSLVAVGGTVRGLRNCRSVAVAGTVRKAGCFAGGGCDQNVRGLVHQPAGRRLELSAVLAAYLPGSCTWGMLSPLVPRFLPGSSAATFLGDCSATPLVYPDVITGSAEIGYRSEGMRPRS